MLHCGRRVIYARIRWDLSRAVEMSGTERSSEHSGLLTVGGGEFSSGSDKEDSVEPEESATGKVSVYNKQKGSVPSNITYNSSILFTNVTIYETVPPITLHLTSIIYHCISVSYFYRTVNDWNKLPLNLIELTDTDSFINELHCNFTLALTWAHQQGWLLSNNNNNHDQSLYVC